MSESGYGYKYKNVCLACGRQLKGRGTKRHLLINGHSIGYVCYGYKACGNLQRRDSLIRATFKVDKQIQCICGDLSGRF